MKRLLTILMGCFFLFLASTMQAQIKFGPVAGVNFSTMTFKSTDSEDHYDPQMLVGFHIGGMAEFSVSENFVIQPAILFSGKGSKYEEDFGEETWEFTINPGFIEVPVYAAYKFDLGSANLLLKAGPYFGYGFTGKISDDEEEEDIEWGSDDDSFMKPFDYGVGLGAGVDLNGFLISLQYQFGLANLSAYDEVEMKIGVFGVSLAYLFGTK
ncbi:MAG: PorT family protein [Bacteroidales bacterium]|jgi:hypothetical protein|nr:PorT family protein [Bacteroidales bacterium]